MPCGDVVDPILGCLVEDPLGRLTGDIGVEARRHRLVVLAFGGTRDDPHRGNQPPVALEDLRFPIGDLGHGREELDGIHGFGEDTANPGRRPLVFGERFEFGEP